MLDRSSGGGSMVAIVVGVGSDLGWGLSGGKLRRCERVASSVGAALYCDQCWDGEGMG